MAAISRRNVIACDPVRDIGQWNFSKSSFTLQMVGDISECDRISINVESSYAARLIAILLKLSAEEVGEI